MSLYTAVDTGPSGWDVTLALSTVALAVATFLLVAVGAIAARVAVRELKAGHEAVRADHARRRGEATMAAIAQFTDRSRGHHAKLLAAARAATAKARETEPDARVTIKDLLRMPPKSGQMEHYKALQAWLNDLETLALGMRLGVYDVNVGFHLSRGVVRLLWDQAAPYVQDVRAGKVDDRPAQPSAYEHCQWLCRQFEAMDSTAPVYLQGSLPSVD